MKERIGNAYGDQLVRYGWGKRAGCFNIRGALLNDYQQIRTEGIWA